MYIYLIIFAICLVNMIICEKAGVNGKSLILNKNSFLLFACFAFIFSPILIFFGCRIDVGTDYRSYVSIYNKIKTISAIEYISQRLQGRQEMEIGFYIINRIAYFIFDNEHTMFFLVGLIMFGFFYAGILEYENISYSFALLIFLLVQYCTAVNISRFALAYCVVFFGYKYIIKDKPLKYVCCILFATLLHRSAICCLLFWLLKEFKTTKLSRLRDYFFYIGVIMTPLITRIGMLLAMKIDFFHKYFTRYNINLNNGSLVFLWRCLPSIVVLRLVIKCYKINLEKYRVLLNIQLCRIPLLYIGYYFKHASRLDFYAWLSEVILIPIIISKLHSSKNRLLVSGGFIFWYSFIFFMYYVVQGGDLIPYRSVFG